MMIPIRFEVYYNEGCRLLQAGKFADALKMFQLSVALNPKLADGWNNVGFCANHLDKLEEAEAAFRKALEFDPRKMISWCNLGNLLKDTSRFEEALEAYERAARINHKFPGVWRGQMLVLSYLDHDDLDDYFARLQFLGQQMTRGITPLPEGKREKHAKLRVGWHSSDLYSSHPVARNLAPFFDSRADDLEYYLYLDVAKPDATSNWYASKATVAVNVNGMTDRAVAEHIRRDEIDVMIYLAGRLDHNRPQIAAYRPAPVNVSMFDIATSGIPGMDYLVVDKQMLSFEEQFTEKLIALDNVYVHDPLPHAPDVAPAPRLKNGYTTFGCFNNPVKIGPRTLKLWQNILLDQPTSRLVLHYKAIYGLPVVRERILAGMPKIDPQRITFSDKDLPNAGHLARYTGIDIALDPLAFSGSTTTFEALHQGVPVITLEGNTIVSRWSASLVGKVAPEFVAEDEDNYRGIVHNWSNREIDRPAIRQKLLASPICQTGSTVRDFEAALRGLRQSQTP